MADTELLAELLDDLYRLVLHNERTGRVTMIGTSLSGQAAQIERALRNAGYIYGSPAEGDRVLRGRLVLRDGAAKR